MRETRIERARTRSIVDDELRDAFEREVFAVEGNEHGVGGDERIEGEQPERRRRVDEDVVEVARAADRGALKATLAAVERDELDLGAGQLPIGRKERETSRCPWRG